MVQCVTELCPWFETSWIITEYEDGSIPDPYSKIGEKQYPRLSQESVSKVEDNIRRQLEAEQRAGSQVTNPNG
jgi:hypothetical protein